MIRLATLRDVPEVVSLVERFIKEDMPDPPEPDPEVIKGTVLSLIEQQNEYGMAVVSETDGKISGILLAVTAPSFFSKTISSIELAYYVPPEYRKSRIWRDLLKTYEEWAKEIAKVDHAVVALLDQRVGKLYERLGYRITEVSYKKELK